MSADDIPHEDRYFRSLLEAAPDAFVIVDARGTIRLVNAQTERLFGYDRSELVGQPVEILVPESALGHHQSRRDGYVVDPHTRPMGGIDRDLAARRKDGTEFPVEISLAPLETSEGLVISAAVRDVTERARLQQEADRMREELIATVSHELRTPLSSIIGYTELLADLGSEHLSDVARDLLEVIERNAQRELRLVDDLLTVASVTHERLVLNTSTVDLARLAADAVAAARPLAEAGGLTLLLEVEGQPGDSVVVGDQMRLGQVLDNLLTNAVKFTPAGGTVTVAVRRDEGSGAGGGSVVVDVRDTGVGVDPEEVPRVFERLFRARHAVESHARGAGLGLSIAQAIVTAHGGSIAVQSEPGVGTTVSVRLPPATAQNSRDAGSSIPRSAS
ncbi:MAG: ATP-binding protein [Nocardioides sp.]|nr:ATP-binding protein [Nocardioides sp.]